MNWRVGRQFEYKYVSKYSRNRYNEATQSLLNEVKHINLKMSFKVPNVLSLIVIYFLL